MSRDMVAAIGAEFGRYRGLAEGAAAQLSLVQLRERLHPEVNSIAVVMKHVAGNLRSRWTEPFTTDGEKAWRDRDTEFVDTFGSREELEAWWAAGWGALEGVLQGVTDADLGRELRIRGEAHTLARALARSVAHTAYHCGQIVQTARAVAGRDGAEWKTLTVARGGSAAHNRGMGFEAGAGPKGGDGRNGGV